MASTGWTSAEAASSPPTVSDWFDGYVDVPNEILFDRFALEFFDMNDLTGWITSSETREILEDWKTQELDRTEYYIEVKELLSDDPAVWLRTMHKAVAVMRQLERGTKNVDDRPEYAALKRWSVFVRQLVDEGNVPFDAGLTKPGRNAAIFETAYGLLLTATLDLMVRPWSGFFHLLLGGPEVVSFIDPKSDVVRNAEDEGVVVDGVAGVVGKYGSKKITRENPIALKVLPSTSSKNKSMRVRFGDSVSDELSVAKSKSKPTRKSLPKSHASPSQVSEIFSNVVKPSLPAAATDEPIMPQPAGSLITIPDSESDDGDGLTRCICGATESDEEESNWILCEGCEVWQHTDCVKDVLPRDYQEEDFKYLCELCDPLAHSIPARMQAPIALTDGSVLEGVEEPLIDSESDEKMEICDPEAHNMLAQERTSITDIGDGVVEAVEESWIASDDDERIEPDSETSVVGDADASLAPAEVAKVIDDDEESLEALLKMNEELDDEFQDLEYQRAEVEQDVVALDERANEVE